MAQEAAYRRGRIGFAATTQHCSRAWAPPVWSPGWSRRFKAPNHSIPFPPVPGFTFEALNRGLCERGFIIYPGKLTQVNTFRIGTTGRLFPADIEQPVHAVSRVLPTLNRSWETRDTRVA